MDTNRTWLDDIIEANADFRNTIDREMLPVRRTPGNAVITCMDPRVNLAAIGIRPFSDAGEGYSSTRIIRTIGAIADDRSLIVGFHLAGITEVAVLMHTDCGCSSAFHNIDKIEAHMVESLDGYSMDALRRTIGEPFIEKLRSHLHAFVDPYQACEKEVDRIRHLPFVPEYVVIHGLVYDIETGAVDVVANGYAGT